GMLAQARLLITEVIPRRAPRPARMLPLSLSRQAVTIPPQNRDLKPLDSVVGLEPLRDTEKIAELNRIVPGDVLYRQVVGHLEHARIRAGDRTVLTLRHLGNPQVIRPRNPHRIV